MAEYPHFNNPSAQNNFIADRRQQDAQRFNQMVQMLSVANRADGQTMLGFVLGKLLHDTWMHYKKKRDADAYEKGANTELKPPLTGEALQREENFRQYMGIPTMQEAYRQTLYHGGQSPAEYYGKQLLTGKPQTAAAQPQATAQATPQAVSTQAQATIPAYQQRAVQQVTGYSPQTGSYFQMTEAKTPTTTDASSWDSSKKFDDMRKEFGTLNNMLGGWQY